MTNRKKYIDNASYDFYPDYDFNDIKFITESEDKAIHKKLEELKENGK